MGTIGTLDFNIAVAESLGEFGTEEPLQIRHAHFCSRHVPCLACPRLSVPATLSWDVFLNGYSG
jgi:hypothetical protein